MHMHMANINLSSSSIQNLNLRLHLIITIAQFVGTHARRQMFESWEARLKMLLKYNGLVCTRVDFYRFRILMKTILAGGGGGVSGGCYSTVTVAALSAVNGLKKKEDELVFEGFLRFCRYCCCLFHLRVLSLNDEVDDDSNDCEYDQYEECKTIRLITELTT